MLIDIANLEAPEAVSKIDIENKAMGFNMPCDDLTGALLRALVASKPKGKFLELGTGTGRSTAWILEGMDSASSLISVESEASYLEVARKMLGEDKRLILINDLGENVLQDQQKGSFDLVFADAFPGKYNHLEEALALLKIGGIYLIDDMLPQPNWPQNHDKNVDKLIAVLENDDRFIISKMNWSTGIILATKIK